MVNLADIEGIEPAHAAKLAEAGLRTIDDLLAAGGTALGRADLAVRTGIDQHLILEWVNRADLYRIEGVGSVYTRLLEAAGVDSVGELAERNATDLQAKLFELNERRNLVHLVPREAQVVRWIEQAKRLRRGDAENQAGRALVWGRVRWRRR